MPGISDVPVKAIAQDCFGLERYVKGMSKYILNCDTPTTIAIQGDWGCGKTSMLNMIKQELGSDVKSIWFNTWQYSKFNLDDRLSISLLTHLYSSLDDGGKNDSKVLKNLSKLLHAGVKIGTYFIDSLGAQKLADDLGNINDNGFHDNDTDCIRIIEELKKDYQKKINDIYAATGKRVVVFIDDLDRLAPSKAVDLMEILKLFLDCQNCVYVLAIDYEVVTRGITEKYGNDFGEKQGKKFFDKIIQVPFFVPVEQYNITNYIWTSLSKEIDLTESDVEQYARMIKCSVGCNPRSMKRLFNVFTLLIMINEDLGFKDDMVTSKMLFAILCFQLSMQEVYKYLVEHCDDITDDDLKKLSDGSFPDNAENSNVLGDINDVIRDNEISMDNTSMLLKELADIILDPDEAKQRENKIKLENILSISSSTNNTNVNTNGGAGELTESKTIKKWINDTDIRYNIMTARSEFHIGYGKLVELECNGKVYHAKMHSKTKGRIDRLAQFYNDTGLKKGDCCLLEYRYDKDNKDNAKIICKVLDADGNT